MTAMTRPSTTFRIFISSTFNDLRAERNALQEHVFPRLRNLCAQYGCHFQAVDLRWGVSEAAAVEQRTMRICLEEIARSQRQTPRPNFVALLGDRYGWRPLPDDVLISEYQEIAEALTETEAGALWQERYRLDENAVPPRYILLPRRGHLQDYAAWQQEVEHPLHKGLTAALQRLGWPIWRRRKYLASATELEIVAGALGVADAREHVFCFSRKIRYLPQDQRAGAFLDLESDGTPDTDAQARLQELRTALWTHLGPEHFFRYEVGWTGDNANFGHLDHLCEDVYKSLVQVIEPQLEEARSFAAEPRARDTHEIFLSRQTAVARWLDIGEADEPTRQISTYLLSTSRRCLALLGEPGSGVSGVIARAVEAARSARGNANVVVRFVGATTESLNSHALLSDLSSELRRLYGAERQAPGIHDFESAWLGTLSVATTEAPLIVFLDGLAHLEGSDDALAWLPSELPEHVHLVVSVSSSAKDMLARIVKRLPAKNLVRVRPPEALRRDRAAELLGNRLAAAGRTVQESQREHVLSRLAGSSNPLYWDTFEKFAFEEILLWHSYDEIPVYKGKPGFASDVEGLLRDVLWRITDAGGHGPALVANSMGYLCASRMGLAEDELLDLLLRDLNVYAEFVAGAAQFPPDLIRQAGRHVKKETSTEKAVLGKADAATDAFLREVRNDRAALTSLLSSLLANPDGPRLPTVLWARLRADLAPYLIAREADGVDLLDLFHRQLHDVASEDFLARSDPKVYHRRLATYFLAQPLRFTRTGIINQRKVAELPYQLAKGELWPELAATLTDLEFLQTAAHAIGTEDLLKEFEFALRQEWDKPEEHEALTVLRAALGDSVREHAVDPTTLPQLLAACLARTRNPLLVRLLRQIGQRQ